MAIAALLIEGIFLSSAYCFKRSCSSVVKYTLTDGRSVVILFNKGVSLFDKGMLPSFQIQLFQISNEGKSIMQLLQPVKIFKGLGLDAAHCGLTDFYPQHLNALQSALNSAEPFDTGWYSVKKESQTARVSCLKDAEKVLVEVSCEMDSLKDLIDSAIWEACGKNDYAPSGRDAMGKRYPRATDRQIQIAMKRFESQASWYDLGYDNYEKDSRTIEIGDSSEAVELIKDTITSLASACEKSLENKYQSLVLAVSKMDEIVKEVVEK